MTKSNWTAARFAKLESRPATSESKKPAALHRNRGTLHRHLKQDRIAISPHRDKAAITALRAAMAAAFAAGDLDRYFALDRELRRTLTRAAPTPLSAQSPRR
jgi:hypothetical protein